MTAAQIPLFEISPDLDRSRLAHDFAATGRVQIRDVLTPGTAATVSDILRRSTPWGLSWMTAAESVPTSIRAESLPALAKGDGARVAERISVAAGKGDYAFLYAQYPMLTAYLDKWQAGGPHDLLLEHINDAPFLDLVRSVTGMADLIKADAQATLYAAGHFLGVHDDSHVAEGWRVAYVLNFCQDWRPDWGGYLMFYDDEGDVVQGFRPRFNALNLFAVPQRHNVSYVPPFAPAARFAITGWLRDR